MILILKTGSAPSPIRSVAGDFERWFAQKMNLEVQDYQIHETGNYQELPPRSVYQGIIITGSPDMVNDVPFRDSPIARWLLVQQNSGTPILGVCFGHQLLAVLNGGSVSYHPGGIILGGATTYLNQAGIMDSLLGFLPPAFPVYKSHSQSIQSLPESAVVLASNGDGIIDAVKFNANTWGVQFHPEFDAAITRLYLKEKRAFLEAEGLDPDGLLNDMQEVDFGIQILRKFRTLIQNSKST